LVTVARSEQTFCASLRLVFVSAVAASDVGYGRHLLPGDRYRAAGMLRTAVSRSGSIADDVSTDLVVGVLRLLSATSYPLRPAAFR